MMLRMKGHLIVSLKKATQYLTVFVDIRNWIRNIEQHATEGVNKILVGNKCDMLEKKAINTEQGQALADEFGVKFLETSAKSNIGIKL